MSSIKNLSLKIKTFLQLGPKQSLYFLLYQAGLHTDFFYLSTPLLDTNSLLDDEQLKPNWFLNLPEKQHLFEICGQRIKNLVAESEEILLKKIRYFGGEVKSLMLAPEKSPAHWSHYERGRMRTNSEDIKFIWEPARFNWAVSLGKAYYLSGDEKYARAFWEYFEEFNQANPLNRGLNWISAQEIALRLIALVVAVQLIKPSLETTPARIKALSISVAGHASRIPATIIYAKAQNNNHLISEAVGLFTAAVFLPNHPKASYWRLKGLRWFNQAILSQIEEDGTYIQHSSNYHRMMLMLSLWMQLLLEKNNQVFDDLVIKKLAATSEWLADRLDADSGQVPNLGHNDGTHFLPLSNSTFYDYRPVIQASSRTFLARAALNPGAWDDLCLWLGLPMHARTKTAYNNAIIGNAFRLGDEQNWALLRAAKFSTRPAHADQLHVDLWYRSQNIALDAGTYQYNAPPPWENSLAITAVHNTVSINDKDQMTRAGKFLWLDWAQAEVTEKTESSITATHNGYRKLGILHRRTLQRENASTWLITDDLLPTLMNTKDFQVTVNWLVPDHPYKIKVDKVTLNMPFGVITLSLNNLSSDYPGMIDIYRAGESLMTGKKEPVLGWYSPTYGVKNPALSIRFTVIQKAPIQIRSRFQLPE